MNELGKRLRELRETRGLTVRDFADRLGKTPGYISRIETRGELPSPELLCQVAELLNAPPEELLELAKRDQIDRTEQDINARHASALMLHRKEKT